MPIKRRKILKILPAVMLPVTGFAELLVTTPKQTSGPFYPDNLPLDRDNDLIIINDNLTPAIGVILHLSGQVYDTKGRAIKNAAVEIWQTDNNGRYIHSRDFNEAGNDRNFQGFGQFLTDTNGEYRFRTIRPVAYGAGFTKRTPHIHFAVHARGYNSLITQMYFADEDNSKDGLWTSLSPAQKPLLTRHPQPLPDTKLNEQAVKFNIILG